MKFFCYILISTQAFIQKLLSEEYESTKNELRKNQEKTLLFLDITKADTKCIYNYIMTIAKKLKKTYTLYKLSATDVLSQFSLNKLFQYINKNFGMQTKGTISSFENYVTYKLSCKYKIEASRFKLDENLNLELFFISDSYIEKSTQYLISDIIKKKEVNIQKMIIFVFSDNIEFDYFNVLQQIFFQNLEDIHEYRDHPFYLYYMLYENSNKECVLSILKKSAIANLENQKKEKTILSLFDTNNKQDSKLVRNSHHVNRSFTSHDLLNDAQIKRDRAVSVGNKVSCKNRIKIDDSNKNFYEQKNQNLPMGFFVNIYEFNSDFFYTFIDANLYSSFLKDTKDIKCCEMSDIHKNEHICIFSSPVCSAVFEKLVLNNESTQFLSLAYFEDKYKNDFEQSSSDCSGDYDIISTENTRDSKVVLRNYEAALSKQTKNKASLERYSHKTENSECDIKVFDQAHSLISHKSYENIMELTLENQDDNLNVQNKIAEFESVIINQKQHSLSSLNNSLVINDSKNDVVIDRNSNNYNNENDKKSFTNHIYENVGINRSMYLQSEAGTKPFLTKKNESICHRHKTSDRYFEIFNLDENNTRTSSKQTVNKNFDKISVHSKNDMENNSVLCTDSKLKKRYKANDHDYAIYSYNKIFSNHTDSFYDEKISYYITDAEFIKNEMQILLKKSTEIYYFYFEHKLFNYKIDILITISDVNKRYYLQKTEDNAREITVYDILHKPSIIIYNKVTNKDSVESEMILLNSNLRNLLSSNNQQRNLNTYELCKSRITQFISYEIVKTNFRCKTTKDFENKIETFFTKHKNSYSFKSCFYRLKRKFVFGQDFDQRKALYKENLDLKNVLNLKEKIFLNQNNRLLTHNTNNNDSLDKYDDQNISFVDITDADCFELSATCKDSRLHKACPLYKIYNKYNKNDETSYLLFDNTEGLSKAVGNFLTNEKLRTLFNRFFNDIILHEEYGSMKSKVKMNHICSCFFINRSVRFYEELLIYDYNDSNYVEEYINGNNFDTKIKDYIGFVLIRILKSFRAEFYEFHNKCTDNFFTKILLDTNDTSLKNMITYQWPEKKIVFSRNK
ncbi:hypothetical protein COBT_000011 [Conglomerata obtusa]